ncbi:MAG: hypothetical protein ACTSU4_13350 [Promethearchaeota archaeon]
MSEKKFLSLKNCLKRHYTEFYDFFPLDCTLEHLAKIKKYSHNTLELSKLV